MIVSFTLFRSKYPNEIIVEDKLEYPIEDTVLISLDFLISKLIQEYSFKNTCVRRFGLAYIGSAKINSIEINDKDDFELNEDGFKSLVDHIFKDVVIIWNKK